MKKIDIDLSTVEWRRSARSVAGDNCVEIAFLPEGHVAMRDGKNPDGPALIFTAGEWAAFVAGANDGEFDRPAS